MTTHSLQRGHEYSGTKSEQKGGKRTGIFKIWHTPALTIETEYSFETLTTHQTRRRHNSE